MTPKAYALAFTEIRLIGGFNLVISGNASARTSAKCAAITL
jgi:hypothetical protein